ncbi:hypothetical protein [Armatimonas sp.]|uniref:hypothetical protein n=1 Tax=Armatimonas sp. TaxID=1872638 RepID=UPI00374DAF31
MTSVDTLEPGESPPPHRARIQWGVGEVVGLLALLVTIGTVLAGFWSKSARAEQLLQQHEEKLRSIPGLEGDVREIKTDLRWIRERMEKLK